MEMVDMKTLIIYASKTGTTESCAKKLALQLRNAELFDLQSGDPDISEYDIIVIGGSIRAGMLHKAAKKYIKKNLELLKSKKLAFYVCSADTERSGEYFKANIPAELLTKAICSDSFGGEMDISKQKGLSKLIVKKALEESLKKGVQPPCILPERINCFAEKLKTI